MPNSQNLDTQLSLAHSDSSLKFMKNTQISWGDLMDKLSVPKKDNSCTLDEYVLMDTETKLKKKNMCGSFLAGYTKDGRRRRLSITTRSIIALDLDDAEIKDIKLLERGLSPLCEYEFFMHTTRKHTDMEPRYRLLIPLEKEIDAQTKYVPTARIISSIVCNNQSRSMDVVDPCSFNIAQLMFYPSICSDGSFNTIHNEGKLLNADELLSNFGKDWEISKNLPRREGESFYDNDGKLLQDPRDRGGLVGAFCSTFSIEEAMQEFIPGIYEIVDDNAFQPRAKYTAGTGSAAAVIYDEGTFIYSNHTNNDPAHGQNCNAFDMVRIHLFHELDEDGSEENSFQEMLKFCLDIEEVKALAEGEEIQYDLDFDVLEEEDEQDSPEESLPVMSLYYTDLINPAPELDLSIFGDFWEKIILEGHQISTSPTDYVAWSVFTFVSAILGNRRWVQGKKNGWFQPPVLWTTLVGGSSATKSPAINLCRQAYAPIMQKKNIDFPERMSKWRVDTKIAKKQSQHYDNMIAKGLEQGAEIEDLLAIPKDFEIPKKPVRNQFIVDDFTIESLATVYLSNPEGLFVVSDELEAFLKEMGKYSNSGAADRARYLTAYDGLDKTINREKNEGEVITIPRFSLALLNGAQPDIIRSVAKSKNDGLYQRIITIWPKEEVTKDYQWDSPSPGPELTDAFELLSSLEMYEDPIDGSQEPVFVRIPEKVAMKAFAHWYNGVRNEERKEHNNTKLGQTFGKSDGMVLRLAICLDYMWWAAKVIEGDEELRYEPPKELSMEAVEKAVELRETYIKPMQIRSMGGTERNSVRDPAIAVARYIVESKSSRITARDIRNASIVGRDTGLINDCLDFLEDKNWLEKVLVPAKSGKGRPSVSYKVHKAVKDLTKP